MAPRDAAPRAAEAVSCNRRRRLRCPRRTKHKSHGQEEDTYKKSKTNAGLNGLALTLAKNVVLSSGHDFHTDPTQTTSRPTARVDSGTCEKIPHAQIYIASQNFPEDACKPAAKWLQCVCQARYRQGQRRVAPVHHRRRRMRQLEPQTPQNHPS